MTFLAPKRVTAGAFRIVTIQGRTKDEEMMRDRVRCDTPCIKTSTKIDKKFFSNVHSNTWRV